MFKRKTLLIGLTIGLSILLCVGLTIAVRGAHTVSAQNAANSLDSESHDPEPPPHLVAVVQPLEQDPSGAQTKFYYGSAPLPASEAQDPEPRQHCVVQIDPIQSSELASKLTPRGCFNTFSEAISVATGGAVHLPQAFQSSQITPALLASSQANTVIGIDWSEPNFSGVTLIWTTQGGGCTGSSTFGVPLMPSGWNNVVSSAQGFGGCNHYWHYDFQNWTGPLLDCGAGCGYMGSLDNHTSSERWCASSQRCA
jgi:hypothetical protein